jgi:hypothetical protein
MSNWGTMVAELLADGQKPDNAGEAPRAMRAICDSIALHRREHLYFGEARGQVTLIAGQERYGIGSDIYHLPQDFVSVRGQTIDLDRNGDPNQRWQLRWKPAEEMDDVRRLQAHTSWPEFFTFYGDNLELWPKPDAGGTPATGPAFVYASNLISFAAPVAGSPGVSVLSTTDTTVDLSTLLDGRQVTLTGTTGGTNNRTAARVLSSTRNTVTLLTAFTTQAAGPTVTLTASTVDIVRFRYIRTGGMPIKINTGTGTVPVWKFYKPWTTADMTDAYPDPAAGEVNPWFDTTVGYNVIRHHALFKLWSGPWRATAGEIQAQQMMYVEALTALQEITGSKNAPRQVQPYRGEEDW